MARTKKRWKRLLKFLLYFSLVMIGLFFLLFISLRFFFSTERLKNIAIATVEKSVPRKLLIENVYLNLFKGFEFNNIQLVSLSDSIDNFPVKNAKIKKILLKYDLGQLVHRRLVIHQIVVHSPQIELAVKAAQAPPDTAKRPPLPPDSLFAQKIPLTIRLKHLLLQDAEIKFLSEDSQKTQNIYLSGLDLAIDDVTIPKGVLSDQDSLITGTVHLECEKTRLLFSQATRGNSDLELSAIFDLKTDLQMGRLDDLGISMNFILYTFKVKSPAGPPLQVNFPFAVNLNAKADLKKQHLKIRPIKFVVDGQEWFDLHVQLDKFLADPILEIGVDRGAISVKQAYSLARQVLPDSLMPLLFFQNENSMLHVTDLKLWGPIPDGSIRNALNFTGRIELDDFSGSADHGRMGMDKLKFMVRTNGLIGGKGLLDLSAFTQVSYDSFYYKASDTLSVHSGKCNFSTEVHLNEKMVPTFLSSSLNIHNILGSNLDWNFALSGSKSMHSLAGSGWINLTDIDINQFVPSPISTIASINLKLNINTLDSIAFQSRFLTNSLTYTSSEGESETLPAIDLYLQAQCRADTLFKDVEASPISLKMNDLFEMSASAQIVDGGRKSFSFLLSHLYLNHKAVFAWIPMSIREQIADLEVEGSTLLTAQVKGHLTSALPEYQATAILTTENTNIRYPIQQLYISGLKIKVLGETSSNQMSSANVSVRIDSTRMDNLEGKIFLNNSLSFTGTSKDFQSVQIRNGRIDLPAFFTSGDFQVSAGNLALNPTISLTAHIQQELTDTLKIIGDIELCGKSEVVVDMEMDTSLINLSGLLKTSHLNVSIPDQIDVRDININLKIHQKIKPKGITFIGRDTFPIQTPSRSSVDYLLYRSYYRSSISDLSYINVSKIQAANYTINNLAVEMFLGEGIVEIPYFICDVYGGNFGGQLSLNLAGGNLSEATFQLWSHFSGINSALLIPGATGTERKGILNGNMNFNGSGLDPQEKILVEGFLNITEIEPKVADNLLRSLDPQGLDPGIKSTRKLINLGFKPKLMAFRLQHGYFYPSIPLTQPWYIPVRISGGNIELNRLPVEFFIERAKQFSAAAK